MDNHVWIDGPDGPGYHCPVCGVSRCEDYANTSCVDILLDRGDMKLYLLESFTERERLNWERWQHAKLHSQMEAKQEPVTMTRGEWYVKRLREWLKGVWIWKSVP